MVLMSMTQLVGNQFGFDRAGFRVFVLCPARRRDILLGKNLAVAAPLGLGLAHPRVVLQRLSHGVDHLLAAVAQAVTMYLLFCLLANMLSILAPMPVATGTLKPTKMKGLVFLMHFLFTLLYPLVLLPTLLPLGMEVRGGRGVEDRGLADLPGADPVWSWPPSPCLSLRAGLAGEASAEPREEDPRNGGGQDGVSASQFHPQITQISQI